jgi:hypothetical protein
VLPDVHIYELYSVLNEQRDILGLLKDNYEPPTVRSISTHDLKADVTCSHMVSDNQASYS